MKNLIKALKDQNQKVLAAKVKVLSQKKVAENVDGPFYVRDNCIRCGKCANIAPENFTQGKSAYYYVYKQPEDSEERKNCQQALKECPVNAIGSDGGKKAASAAEEDEEEAEKSLNPYETIVDPFILEELPKICPVFDSVLKGTKGVLQVNANGEPFIVAPTQVILDFLQKQQFKVTALDASIGPKREKPSRTYSALKSGTLLEVGVAHDYKTARVSFYKQNAPQIKAFKEMLEKNGYKVAPISALR